MGPIFGVIQLELRVKILDRENLKTDLHCLPGEDLRLQVRLSVASAEVKWFKDGEKIVDSGHTHLEEQGSLRALLLLGAESGDSGEYLCVTSDESCGFYVTVEEPPVTIVDKEDVQNTSAVLEGEEVTLTVRVSEPTAPVRWLRNGQQLSLGARFQVSSEGPARALTIRQAEITDSGNYTCRTTGDELHFSVQLPWSLFHSQPLVSAPRCVEFLSELHNVTVLEGECATFKCVLSPEDALISWQLNGSALTPDAKYIMSRNGLCHSLSIQQCRIGDGATVTASAEGAVTKARLRVQEAQVLFVKKLQNVIAEELEDVILEVEVSVEGAEVQWLKQGVVIQPSNKYTLETSGRRHVLRIHNITFSDRGNYRCESLHDKTQARLCVDARKVMLRTPLTDMETYEKETVTFQLELSHPGVEGVWTKDGIRVKPNNKFRVSANSCLHSLTLSAVTLEDSGSIVFTADNIRSCARLTVREPPVTIIKKSQDVGVPETVGARFECELSRAAAEVKWYKDGKEMKPGPHCRIYSTGRRRIVQLSHCRLEDAGTYTCDAGDCTASATLQVYEREVKILKELEAINIQEGDNAVFMCEVSPQDVRGDWFKNGENLKSTNRIKIRQEGSKHFLLICDIQMEDAGEIVFRAKKAMSRAPLTVAELPVRIVKQIRDKTARLKNRVLLECSVSKPHAQVRWFRGHTQLCPSEKYEMYSEGTCQRLIISNVCPEDEALYSCHTLHDESSARLMVEDL
ncbi:obscurin-like protein 1 [Rhinatrema bivittatum]|uniref:obscurin-like protein 1 n=1 Tax=Rhinatrema bivittatum TaxID=194408 RepID=UPI00112C25C9|nr:obscurin-like protein 1 [Rhinatrema bivittatum]